MSLLANNAIIWQCPSKRFEQCQTSQTNWTFVDCQGSLGKSLASTSQGVGTPVNGTLLWNCQGSYGRNCQQLYMDLLALFRKIRANIVLTFPQYLISHFLVILFIFIYYSLCAWFYIALSNYFTILICTSRFRHVFLKEGS